MLREWSREVGYAAMKRRNSSAGKPCGIDRSRPTRYDHRRQEGVLPVNTQLVPTPTCVLLKLLETDKRTNSTVKIIHHGF